jgi:anti-sigma B factor antagonist
MDEVEAPGAKGSAALVEGDPDQTVVKLTGEIDISNVGELGAAVDALVLGAQSVVFDLGGLEFIDSSGIALLLRTAARVPAVSIRQPSRIVRRVLAATGLDSVLEVES